MHFFFHGKEVSIMYTGYYGILFLTFVLVLIMEFYF